MTATLESQPPFSNLQMELLKLFARHLSDEELLEVKQLLSQHFLEKAMGAADKVWTKNNWSADEAVRLSHEHQRTTFKPIFSTY